MFYITRSPITPEEYNSKDDTGPTPQTAFIRDINSGTDNILPATFFPEIGATGVPRVVTVNFFYY
jgi:hypothetical protein